MAGPVAADPWMAPIAILYFDPGSLQLQAQSQQSLAWLAGEYVAHWSDGSSQVFLCAGIEGRSDAKRLARQRGRLVRRLLGDRGVRPVRIRRDRECADPGEMDKASVLLVTGLAPTRGRP